MYIFIPIAVCAVIFCLCYVCNHDCDEGHEVPDFKKEAAKWEKEAKKKNLTEMNFVVPENEMGPPPAYPPDYQVQGP